MRSKRKPIAPSSRLSGTARASISFADEVYAELERIAEENKVSVAWVVRDAVDKYIAARYPIFAGIKENR